MLQRLTDLPAGILGIKALGTVSKEDYERVLEPLLEDTIRASHRVLFLYELGPELDAFTAGAAWEDLRVGVQHLRVFEGCAILSDLGWVREATRLVGFAMPCPVRVFGTDERAQAIAWLQALPEAATASVRLVSQDGIVVFEPKQALRAADFDALVEVVDRRIERHGALAGLVIHAREFPGWENFASMLRHARFVRDHRRKIRRIAFATDSKLASVIVGVADVFAAAEVKRFSYHELAPAIAWAEGAAASTRPEAHATS